MLQSPPSWRRGLKSFENIEANITYVASFVEAWIEIFCSCLPSSSYSVASFVEAWIEIILVVIVSEKISSPPSWRRGLKLKMI